MFTRHTKTSIGQNTFFGLDFRSSFEEKKNQWKLLNDKPISIG